LAVFQTRKAEATQAKKFRAKKVKFSRHKAALECRVARWFLFKPKIPIWVNFGGP
jgi:hypothetical protein